MAWPWPYRKAVQLACGDGDGEQALTVACPRGTDRALQRRKDGKRREATRATGKWQPLKLTSTEAEIITIRPDGLS